MQCWQKKIHCYFAFKSQQRLQILAADVKSNYLLHYGYNLAAEISSALHQLMTKRYPLNVAQVAQNLEYSNHVLCIVTPTNTIQGYRLSWGNGCNCTRRFSEMAN